MFLGLLGLVKGKVGEDMKKSIEMGLMLAVCEMLADFTGNE